MTETFTLRLYRIGIDIPTIEEAQDLLTHLHDAGTRIRELKCRLKDPSGIWGVFADGRTARLYDNSIIIDMEVETEQ